MTNHPFEKLRQLLGGKSTDRRKARRAQFTDKPVTRRSVFEQDETTRWDPGAQRFETIRSSTHHFLACGCRVDSPYAVLGLCSGCSHGIVAWLLRRRRLVCTHHRLCLRCRAKRMRRYERSEWWKAPFLLVLWPFFYVEIIDESDDAGGGPNVQGPRSPSQPPR